MAQIHQNSKTMIFRANVADSPLCPAGPEQSQASLQLASFTWCLIWLALAGREGGQIIISLRFHKGSHRRDEESFFPSSCLLPSVPYRCVPRHVGQSPCRSMKLCTGNWRQDMHTPPLLIALPPPHPKASSPSPMAGPERLEHLFLL